MIIYRNKASEKYFIYIEDFTEDEAIFVLPVDDKDGKARIKNLKLDLFGEEQKEGEDKVFIEKGLISEKQFEKDKHFHAQRISRMVAGVKKWHYIKKKRLEKQGGKLLKCCI